MYRSVRGKRKWSEWYLRWLENEVSTAGVSVDLVSRRNRIKKGRLEESVHDHSKVHEEQSV
jgi:hypothetical protein